MTQNITVHGLEKCDERGPYGDELHAGAWLADGSYVKLVREGVHGAWTIHWFDEPVGIGDYDKVWQLPGRTQIELTMLVEQGLSPAEALDFWFVIMRGLTASEVGKRRDVSHQAVSENVHKARTKLKPDQ